MCLSCVGNTKTTSPSQFIEILKSRRFPYQTTTGRILPRDGGMLYYIVSLHQTTTNSASLAPLSLVVLYRFSTSNHNCRAVEVRCLRVVLYRFSTSNHNRTGRAILGWGLYYIVSLHQTTTVMEIIAVVVGCIISFLYIKPQPRVRSNWQKGVVNAESDKSFPAVTAEHYWHKEPN